jgi:uridine kinase
MSRGRVVLSTSTWQQPLPEETTATRAAILDAIVGSILERGSRRLRIAIDGRTAAGKTTIGHELAQRVAVTGRDAFRASLDDFKRPWSEAHLYDRTSAAGYYTNAFDYDAARRLLLDPAAPTGSGKVALCSIDPLTQIDHSTTLVEMSPAAVLLVDGVFLLRPALDDVWDLRIWIDIDADLALHRGIERDADMEGGREGALRLHRDRYLAAEDLYLDQCDPPSRADVVLDNRDFSAPKLVRA